MAASPLSRLQRGLYWTLALAVAGAGLLAVDAQAKAKSAKTKPRAAAPEPDPLTEWKLVNEAAIELRAKITKRPRNENLRQELAKLAVRSAVGAERALAIGNASLFDSYRRQFKDRFHDTRWRLGRMAAQGSGAAEYASGVVELHGFLATPNTEAACKHFLAALNKGDLGARFRASQCVDTDDPERARALMREAAANGHPAAAEIVGRTCIQASPPDTACAWERMTMAASAGRPSAQSLLGWMYTQGFGGRARDMARGVRLYEQAARAGDASAQNNLGELYETGSGVAADPRRAIDWYRKAAGSGFAPAQFNLGRMYAAGSGVTPKDFAEARRWLEQAESGGIGQARQLLDWMARNTPAN